MSSTSLTVLPKTLPAVTIDAAAPAIVQTKPAIPKGGLKLAELERFAPALARDLYDRFDFAKSVHSGGEPSLSVKKSYGLVTTGEFRQLLVVKKALDFRNRLIAGVVTSAATIAGGFGAAAATGHDGFAIVGLVAVFTTLIGGMGAGAAWGDKRGQLSSEVQSIERSEAALERAKETKQLR